MVAPVVSPIQGIGQLLVSQGLLVESALAAYQKEASRQQIPLTLFLSQQGILSSAVIAQTTAQHFDLPLLNLDSLDLQTLPTQLLSTPFIKDHRLLPIGIRDNHLYLATDYPAKPEALQEIQFHTGLSLALHIVDSDQFSLVLDKLDEPLIKAENPLETLVPLVQQIIQKALAQGASDIHFETYESSYRIRYRQDGILHPIASPPRELAPRIAARLKVLARLDIAEKRLPQDGSFSLSLGESKQVDCRISTCPTDFGEKIVLRLLDPKAACFGMDSLGLNPLQERHFMQALQRPQGMIVVTGPTGSGKTVTLYSALHQLNRLEVNILTAEDPIEITLPGINQVAINPKIGLTFAKALRAFLRQDPDIIMVGEIRDQETADMAVKAAHTGHLVLSTLHTNSALDTLDRLLHLGLPPVHLASALSLIIAQRLARKLCEHCKIPVEGSSLYQAQGCNHCLSGYKGRVGLFEVLPISQALQHLIRTSAPLPALLALAKEEGMQTIWESGLQQVKAGITTVEEVKRVTLD